jgi:lipopolysaccharide transport system ATP-binding protein
MLYFHVVNDEGVEVFTSFDNDSTWRNNGRPCGKYVSLATIPGNLMSEGIFFITVGIRTINPNIRRLRVEDSVAFHVIDSLDGDSARADYYGNIKGIVRPLLRWQTFSMELNN